MSDVWDIRQGDIVEDKRIDGLLGVVVLTKSLGGLDKIYNIVSLTNVEGHMNKFELMWLYPISKEYIKDEYKYIGRLNCNVEDLLKEG